MTNKMPDTEIDRLLGVSLPGGTHARDWFVPHDTPRALSNVREVVRKMLLVHHESGPQAQDALEKRSKEGRMMGYRNIRPIQSFQGTDHPLQQRQFHWNNKSEGLSTALFAGQEMVVCINDDGVTHQLTYLGMAHPEDFKSMDAAKEAAHDFSRAALLHMLNLVGVREDDGSLRMCLAANGQ